MNNPLTVAGWGVTVEGAHDLSTTPQEVSLPLVALDQCRATLGQITDNMLCAGGVEGHDACQGDSGGPLMGVEPTSNKVYLAGVVSWGVGCGRENLPGVSAKVSNYVTWIQSYIDSITITI